MTEIIIGLALAAVALWLLLDRDCEHAPLQFDEATLRNQAADAHEEWLRNGRRA